MSCKNQEWRTYVPVWTKPATTDKIFFPATPVMPSSAFNQIRVNFEIVHSDASVNVRRAYRQSDDGVSWDNPTLFGPAEVTAEGWSYDDFTAVSDLKAFVEIGVHVGPESDATMVGQVQVLTSTRLA